MKELLNRFSFSNKKALKNNTFHQASNHQAQDPGKENQCKTGTGGIPLARKMCYALGGVPYQVTAVAMGISLQIFLLDVVQMEAFYVSMILFVSRAWDAVTDPLVGYLVSRSNWTPIGKLIPWVAFSMPFAILSYVLLWFMPHGSVSQSVSVPWFLTTTCLFETLMSCYNVPYLSLNMFLGGDQRDRDSATAYRMTVEILAMLLASVVQGQVIAVYNTERDGACQQLDQVLETITNTPSPHAASLQGTRKAFLASALVMGSLFFLCSLVLFLGVKEQQAPLNPDQKVRVSYLTALKTLASHVPYQRLVLGFLFSALAFQMSLGNFALFCSHAAGLGANFQYLLLVLLGAASIAVPIWQVVLLRIGKKATLFIGLSLYIPAVAVIGCVPGNLPVFIVMCFLLGFSLATMFLLPWSMLPDVIDDFAVKNPLCQDLEPLFFSCYAFCNKLGGGLSAGVSTVTLHFVGYRAGECYHDEDVTTALIVMFSPVPIVLLLVGMAVFHSYPLHEKRSVQLATEQSESTHSPGQREMTELPTNHQQLKFSLKTRLKWHPVVENNALDMSQGFLPFSSNRTDLKSSRSQGPSVEPSSPASAVNPMVDGKPQKQRWHQPSPNAKGSAKSSTYDGSYSQHSNMKSKVAWV